MKKLFEAEHFSLVLSGGGALGIAHLGVLHDMELYDLVPDEIIGTSMGGIVGACLAIGMREHEIYHQLKNFSSVSKWIAFSFSGNALVKTAKIEKMLDTIFGRRTMSDVLIPLKLIATDLLNGEKKVFDTRDDVLIRDALLATMAIPGIFEEKRIGDRIYADGFLCENLGIGEALFDTVLAVDVLGYNSFEKELPDNFFKTSNVLEMFERSMRLILYNQTRSVRESSDKNILLLEPKTEAFKTFHFHKIDEIRALGMKLLTRRHIEETIKGLSFP